MSTRTFRTIVALVVIGWIFYFMEGCAGQGKQEIWEHCAEEIYQNPQYCWDAEDVLDCEYQRYRGCIRQPDEWYGNGNSGAGII